MNRNALIAIIATIVLIAGFWWWRTHDGSADADRNADNQSASGRTATAKEAPKADLQPVRGGGGNTEISMDDDPVGTLVLEGQVIDKDENPVVGATVVISSNPPRSTQSGEDGTFQFENLVGRTYSLIAQQGDLSAGPAMHELTQKSDPVILTAVPAASVAVFVVSNENGDALRGARVRLRTLDERTATTDNEGAARFRGVGPGWHVLVADADGYAPQSQPVQVADGTASEITARIALSRGSPVLGIVRGVDGKPASGVRVLAESTSEVFSLSDERRDGVLTDGKGEFRIPALAPGSYRLVALKSGFPRATSKSVTVDGVTTLSGVTITLEDGATLSGRVVDNAGAPVAWASVRVQGRKPGRAGFQPGARQSTANEKGEFEIAGLQRGKVVAMAMSDSASSELVEVDLEKSAKEEVTIALSIDGMISGVVVDSSGEPVADAQVTATPDFWQGNQDESFALRGVSAQRTDPGGRFSFAGIPSGSFRIRASRSGSPQSMWFGEGVAAKVGDTDVRITLDAEGGVQGQLVFDTGGNPTDFVVTASWPPGVPVMSSKGEFKVGALPPGTYDVSFQGKNFAATTVRNVTVKPGEHTAMGSVTVARGRSISGRISDSSGRAVEGATVIAGLQIIGDGQHLAAAFGAGNDQAQQIKRTQSDSNGYFQLTGVGRRALVLAAEHPSVGRSMGVDIAAGADSVQTDLSLRGFGSVKGTVKNGDSGVASVQILATMRESSGNQFVVVTTGSDGAFAIDKLPQGTFQIKAMAGAFGSASVSGVEVSVTPGKTVAANIEQEKGDVQLVVEIKGKGGDKIDSAQVFLFGGEVVAENGQAVHNAFVSGVGGAKMAFALTGTSATFADVSPGAKSVCVIPITGNINDPTFMKRLNENRMELHTYCQTLAVTESPTQQTHSMVVPAMTPFPETGDAPPPGDAN